MSRATPPLEPGAETPRWWHGVPCWAFERSRFQVRFLGRGAPARDAALAGWLAPEVGRAAWLEQCHSARVLEARPGSAGDGDALVVRDGGIAAAVASADCVPVVVVGERSGAVIHAGWRGIVAGVVARALEQLGEPPAAAWIGPAIGPCCYEVGPEVAEAVIAASHSGALVAGRPARPRLDLRVAVAAQLAAGGVESTTIVDLCTRCHPELLSSHRRDGERAGRNLTLLWRAD